MKNTKIEFPNSQGHQLSGILSFPIKGTPKAYAVFAHCFTCGKSIKSARNIAQSLTDKGIAVLRFDFSGIGESQGDLESYTFTSNLEDIYSAAEFLRAQYEAPQLLIGHSLGGAAVLFAARDIDSVRAVVTIGAPAHPKHVQHLFDPDTVDTSIPQLKIGSQTLNFSNKFIEDINQQDADGTLKRMRKPLLVLHSPTDETVSISNAKQIYQAAKHPKSFVALDGADHLLRVKKDASYASEIIVAWSLKYLEFDEEEIVQTDHQVVAKLATEDLFTTTISTGKHTFIADEPKKAGGLDLGPSPFELLSSSLAACTAMTVRMYITIKKWEVEDIEVHVNHSKEKNSEDVSIDVFDRTVRIKGNVDQDQLQRILVIANKCPVHKTLDKSSDIRTKIEFQ